MKQMTTAQAAVELGCSPRTIQRAARRLGLEPIGKQFVFSASQLKQIACEINDGPGNPAIAEQSAAGVKARWGKP